MHFACQIEDMNEQVKQAVYLLSCGSTMSIITGLFSPTSGTVIVDGYDIRTDMPKVRESLGLCPQHEVLFDELTVEEHLEFFCRLKGFKGLVRAEVQNMLNSIKLVNKRDAQSRTLSGGMKRRLSVGIAFVGGSKVVFLDEPTSGMDPGSRRSIWDLILKEKKGRTTVLSTHFMDEADLLGDRIAIMAHGKLICCGSSLFLKKKYGGGYHLIMVKEPNCQVHKVTELLRKTIPEVELDQNVGTELSYSLPDGKSELFPGMFEELERRKAELGISSYGCSITKMEEVFIRAGEEAEKGLQVHPVQSVHPMNTPSKAVNSEAISITLYETNNFHRHARKEDFG